MSHLAVLKTAAAAAGLVGVASLAGACGSTHHAASPPPASVAQARRPQASTTSAPARRVRKPVTSTTIPVSTTPAPVYASVPTSAPAAASTSVTTTPTTAPVATSTTVAPPSTLAPTATTATTVAGAPVRVLSDCQNPSYRPSTILLACGDGSSVATQIHWSSWGPTSATGTAVIKQDLCNPNCAQGSQGSFPASITLSQVQAAGASGELFSTLTATFSGASPTGTPTETYNIGAVS